MLPALLENTSVTDEAVASLATSASRHLMETLLKSPRVNQSNAILEALASNPKLDPAQTASVAQLLSSLEKPSSEEAKQIPVAKAPELSAETAEPAEVAPSSTLSSPDPGPNSAADGEADQVLAAYMAEHAAEISSETKPFQPMGGMHEELAASASSEIHTQAVASSSGSGSAAAVKRAPEKKQSLSTDEARGSALQKISKLDTQGRIQLALKGNKEERSLLIRDGTKVVSLAVLESPKITDAEVEKFATQKNVLEAVLRAITMKKRFMKQYAIVRNLTSNPRTPIDVSLGLIKHLTTQDLRHLTGNKDVSDTVRKMATRMFRQKLEANQK